MASIDTSIRINYKHNMIQKLFCLLIFLIFLTASCGPSTGLVTSTVSPFPTLEVTSTLDFTSSSESIPSPVPEIRITNADQALFNGDYSLAQTEYQAAFGSSADPSIQAAALWGLGRVNLTAGNYSAALISFNQLITRYPESPHRIHAHLLRGQVMLLLERFTEAVEAFSSYLALRPGVIDGYVLERRADAYAGLGNYALARDDYQAALSSPHITDDTDLQVKLANSFEALGDSASAFGIYDSLFNSTSDNNLKAQMDLFRGRLHLSLGQPSQAYAYFLNTVENFPEEYESYSALVALVEAGYPVNDLERGLVDYYAGQYGYAIDAFTRFIINSTENDGTAYYFRALALRDSGSTLEALEAFSYFIHNYSSNINWSTACEEKADLQWYLLGEYESAAETLLDYSQITSDISSIPRILFDTARIKERGGDIYGAVNLWESIADLYPGSEYVPQALFLAGILNYRIGDFSKALVDFQRSYLFSSTQEDLARAIFWTGKTQSKLGDSVAAQDSYLRVAAIDLTNFYSLRAQDLLSERAPFGLLPLAVPTDDIFSDRVLAESWMRVTFNLPADTDLTGIGTLAYDERIIRGIEFFTLDMIELAQLEFEDLRVEVSENAIDSFRLGNYLLEMKFYRPAIFALRQVLTLAGMDEQAETLAAPRYFNLVRYGIYYQDLIIPQSLSTGFDPAFIFSLVRQESLYDKDAGSGQGALGLMQITPGTAQLIVDSLGWPLYFHSDDLFRPTISITLGVSHLSDLKISFSNELFPTLAAYNAGQNAAIIWRDLSGPDPDLFLETIRYPETHDYIKSIYEIYFMYSRIYSETP